MANAGEYNTLKVVKKVDFGVYLDGGNGEEILLPKRFVPNGLDVDDEIEVFLYHDNESRLIATTQKPVGALGDVVLMEVVSTTKQGAFLHWGIMKDLFLPLSQQKSRMYVGEKYLVYIYKDEMTGRLAATEHLAKYIHNNEVVVSEGEAVELVVYHKTDIGYKVIINNENMGVLHYGDVFKELNPGDKIEGYIKAIRDDKIDVAAGKRGYKRIESESDKVLRLLQENDGYLPYNDKSTPEDIYEFFGMSKKAFKMAIGSLYKQRKVSFTQTGIKEETAD